MGLITPIRYLNAKPLLRPFVVVLSLSMPQERLAILVGPGAQAASLKRQQPVALLHHRGVLHRGRASARVGRTQGAPRLFIATSPQYLTAGHDGGRTAANKEAQRFLYARQRGSE